MVYSRYIGANERIKQNLTLVIQGRVRLLRCQAVVELAWVELVPHYAFPPSEAPNEYTVVRVQTEKL